MLRILRIDRVLFLVLGLLVGGGALWGFIQLGGGDQLGMRQSDQQVQQAASTDFLTGPLLRTVGVNSYVEKEGVGFKINSLEIYGDGIGLTYTIIPPKAPTGRMTLLPEYFQVHDSSGRAYSAREDTSSVAVGPFETRGYLTLSPTVPDGVKSVTVSIPHMMIVGAVSDGKPKVVEGPWDVEVTINK